MLNLFLFAEEYYKHPSKILSIVSSGPGRFLKLLPFSIFPSNDINFSDSSCDPPPPTFLPTRLIYAKM